MQCRSFHWLTLFACGALAQFWIDAPLAAAAPPTAGKRVSVAGGAIISVPVDPYMTADEEQKILDFLSRPMQVLWDETTPAQIAQDLNPHVRTMVDQRALDDLGIPADTPLSIPSTSNTVPLGSLLIAILKRSDLTFLIRGNVLTITTIDGAEQSSNLPIRIYDVTPLVVRENAEGVREAVDTEELISNIQSSVKPVTTWEVLGGESTIEPTIVRDRILLTITAPTLTQLTIQTLLDRLNAGPAVFGAQNIHRPTPQRFPMYSPSGGMF